MIVVEQWDDVPACLGLNPELFFPHPTDTAGQEKAKAVCAGCPARLSCLGKAIDRGERFGVWGGVALNDRAMTKKEKARAYAEAMPRA